MSNIKEEIVEGNKLIAEFRGCQIYPEFVRRMDKHFTFPDPDDSRNCRLEHLKFHQRWDWLIPAWKEFYKNVINTEWYKDNCTKESNELLEQMEYCLVSDLEIGAAFDKFVSMLNWYNKNK